MFDQIAGSDLGRAERVRRARRRDAPSQSRPLRQNQTVHAGDIGTTTQNSLVFLQFQALPRSVQHLILVAEFVLRKVNYSIALSAIVAI